MILLRYIFFISVLFAPFTVSASAGAHSADFPLWTVIFFATLILSIAFLPLINSEWWARNYRYVCIALSIPAIWIVAVRDTSLLFHTLAEYFSFIILLGSLFVIAGGIVIRTSALGSPRLNCTFLLVGAAFASFIGTTGASMVLIRPLIRANKWRKHAVHVYVFFIFLVSNIGGVLTPLGDPPLFLGYLKGVPFVWTFKLIFFWMFAVGILLCVFYLLDRHYIARERGNLSDDMVIDLGGRRFEMRGKINLLFLLAVLGAFFTPPVIREGVMIAAALFSIYFTPMILREENSFTYHPIAEVAILFAGIFITMIPAMKILETYGAKLGVDTPRQFFWLTGTLSSFLDNAPTYLVFMSTAKSLAYITHITANLVAGVPELFLRAISVGAVFMGANTYVGNGPNFMVKAICEENGIEMPSFFGYILWSAIFLVPLFILITFIFFR